MAGWQSGYAGPRRRGLHQRAALTFPDSRRNNVTDLWLGGRVVMQRTATPYTPVRFRPQPPIDSWLCAPGAKHECRQVFGDAKHREAPPPARRPHSLPTQASIFQIHLVRYRLRTCIYKDFPVLSGPPLPDSARLCPIESPWIGGGTSASTTLSVH
jgi:hypothetical protein